MQRKGEIGPEQFRESRESRVNPRTAANIRAAFATYARRRGAPAILARPLPWPQALLNTNTAFVPPKAKELLIAWRSAGARVPGCLT